MMKEIRDYQKKIEQLEGRLSALENPPQSGSVPTTPATAAANAAASALPQACLLYTSPSPRD